MNKTFYFKPLFMFILCTLGLTSCEEDLDESRIFVVDIEPEFRLMVDDSASGLVKYRVGHTQQGKKMHFSGRSLDINLDEGYRYKLKIYQEDPYDYRKPAFRTLKIISREYVGIQTEGMEIKTIVIPKIARPVVPLQNGGNVYGYIAEVYDSLGNREEDMPIVEGEIIGLVSSNDKYPDDNYYKLKVSITPTEEVTPLSNRKALIRFIEQINYK